MSRRMERVASLIKAELGELILKKLKDPRVRFVTITRVDVPADLKIARVYYSVLGKEPERIEAGRALERAAGFLQHKIAEALKLRFTPRLSFHFDESYEESMEVDRILHKLHKKEEGTDSNE